MIHGSFLDWHRKFRSRMRRLHRMITGYLLLETGDNILAEDGALLMIRRRY